MKESIKEKLKSYEFWVSVASAVMMLLQTISIKINIPYINEVTMAFLSLLTVTGILKKTPVKTKTETVEQNKSTDNTATDTSQPSKTEDTVKSETANPSDNGSAEDFDSKDTEE